MKKKNMKRIACLLAAVSFGGMLTACGGERKEAGEATSFENAPVVHYACANSYESAIGQTGDDFNDNDYIRYIFDKTGIRIEPVLISTKSSDATQQLSVKRAGGEQIDMIVYIDLVQAWMQSNLVIPLNDFFEKYGSEIEGWNPYEENVIFDSGWDVAKKRDVYWGIPGRSAMNQAAVKYFYVRRDWLDKLGLGLPKNTDELGAIMKAFTENDPDGNGKKDTYGMTHKGTSTVNELLMNFGVESWREYTVNDNGDIDPNGKNLISQAMHPFARKQFATIREWCQNGYINNDAITDTNAYEKMITNNKVGVVLDSFTNISKFRTALHNNGYQDAEWEFCKIPIVNSNDGNFYGYVPGHNVSTVAMITSMAKENNYKNIIKLMNWMYSEEGTTFQSYGLEGKEYTTDSDFNKHENSDYIDNKSYLGMVNFGKSYDVVFPDQYTRIYGEDQLAEDYIDAVVNHPGEYSTKRTDIKFEYPDLDEFTTYPDWRKGVESYLLQFTVGDKDPMNDNDWNAYIDECKKYGIQKLMDAAAKVHFDKK